MTYATIQTRVRDLIVDVPTATTGEVPARINESIRRAERRHNFRVMKEELAITTTALTRRGAAVPSDWKEQRQKPYLRIGQDGVLGTRNIKWADAEEQMIDLFSLDDTVDSGTPRYVLQTRDAQGADAHELWIFPFPDSLSQWDNGLYRIVCPYWKFLANLSANGDTNWFTDNMEEYIVAEAAGWSFMMNWDEGRGASWLQIAENHFKEARRTDQRSKMQRSTILPISTNSGVSIARGAGSVRR